MTLSTLMTLMTSIGLRTRGSRCSNSNTNSNRDSNSNSSSSSNSYQ